MWPYLGKGSFQRYLCLKISRWDHPGLSRGALNPVTSVLKEAEEEKTQREEETRRWPRQEGGRDWSDAATAKDTWGHKELEEVRKDPPDLQMECGPADILLLDFWLPELWERTFLSFLNPQFVVIFCYGSSRKLIQRVTCLQEKPLKPAHRAGLLLERRGRESGWRIPGGRASGTGTGLSREAGRADLNFQRPWGTEGNLSLG